MLPGDLPVVLKSDFTQLLELGNLIILQQIHGKYGNNVLATFTSYYCLQES
jgi:hypothetical protein